MLCFLGFVFFFCKVVGNCQGYPTRRGSVCTENLLKYAKSFKKRSVLLYFSTCLLDCYEWRVLFLNKSSRVSELRDSIAWLFFAFALRSPCVLWRVLHVIVVSLRTRTAGRRGQQNACVWQTWQGYHLRVSKLNINVFWSLQKICFKESEVWRKVISNKVIVMLVTQGLLSSFLSRPVTYTSTGYAGGWFRAFR